MSNLNGVDFEALRDESNFCETLLSDKDGHALELDPWQRSYIREQSPYVAVVKTRQGGFSYGSAAKGLARTHIRPFYEKYFVSKSLEEAKRKIQYASELHANLPLGFKLRLVTDAKTELAFQDSMGRISRLKALSSKEPRGMDGDIDIDEIAHFSNARKVFEAATGLVIRGGNRQLSIGSSPLAKSDILYEVITNHEHRYNQFKVYSIPWWLCTALCVNIREAALRARGMPIKERVAVYGSPAIKRAFEMLPLDAFIQEYECGFMDEMSAFMPYELIWSCNEVNYGTDDKELEVEYMFDYREIREPKNDGKDITDLNGRVLNESFWQWVRRHCKGYVEIGFDIGRKRDLSAIVVTDEISGVKEVRAVVTMDRAPFGIQENVLSQAITIVKPKKCRIDNGGMGMPVAEEMINRHGENVVESIGFTNQNKSQMATNIKARFEKHKIKIPGWQPLENHIHSIRRYVSEKGLITYEADSSDHHGDIYWALALTDLRPMETKSGYTPKAYNDAYKKHQEEQELRRRGLIPGFPSPRNSER
jgi:phage FluMu gp28-like protein